MARYSLENLKYYFLLNQNCLLNDASCFFVIIVSNVFDFEALNLLAPIASCNQLWTNSNLVFYYSALELNDDIHLSLSPEPEDEEVFDEIDLNSSSKNANVVCNSTSNIPEGLKLAYRDAKSAPMHRSSSWYDGFLHCLKPVMSSFMGKGKPPTSPTDAAG